MNLRILHLYLFHCILRHFFNHIIHHHVAVTVGFLFAYDATRIQYVHTYKSILYSSVLRQAPEASLTSSCHYNIVTLVLPKIIRGDY